MKTRIDLNADRGELDDGSLDAAVMPFISSCNIACGAHPGYPDPVNFGRLPMKFQTLEVVANNPVRFQPLETGCRAYIAFEGGLNVPVMMGSRSTYVPGGLGSVLRAGDVLPIGEDRDQRSRLQPVAVGGGGDPASVRVIPGPEADWFDCGGLNTFLTEPFTVSAKSDRTGIRMEGNPHDTYRLRSLRCPDAAVDGS